jgi:hypothetical protein
MNVMGNMGFFSGLPSFVSAILGLTSMVIAGIVVAALIILLVYEKNVGAGTKLGFVIVSLVIYAIFLANYFFGLIDDLVYLIPSAYSLIESIIFVILGITFRLYLLFMGIYFLKEANRE